MSATFLIDEALPLPAHRVAISDSVSIDLLKQEMRYNGHSWRIPMPCLRTLLAFHSIGPDHFAGVGLIARLTGMKLDSTHVYICDLRRWLAFHDAPLSIRHQPGQGYYLALQKAPLA